MGDVYSDFYTEMYGVLVWRPVVDFAKESGGAERRHDYVADLQGRPVLDTIRRAFEDLAARI